MPRYDWKCTDCSSHITICVPTEEHNKPPGAPCRCGAGKWVRDFKSEAAKSTFHPSKDTYGDEVRKRIAKERGE